MKPVIPAAIALAAMLAVAACGGREPLTPRTGESLPPAPLGIATPPSAEDLLATDTQSRPGRSDEVLRRSEQRERDRFELPPPG